jgi:hypothetical protein
VLGFDAVTTLPAYIQAPPPPASIAEVQRWEHTRRRRRLLYSEHRADVEAMVKAMVGTVRQSAWGAVDLSANPYLSLWEQTSRLYAAAPVVVAPESASAAVAAAVDAGLWSLMQRVQRDTLGLREMVVRVDVVEGRPVYTPIPPDLVEGVPDPADPTQPIVLTETRWHEGEWVRVTWDARPGKESITAIDARGNDATDRVVGAGFAGEGYPYRIDGRAVVPVAVYHAAETARLWDPYTGCELVEGSLHLGVLLTFFGHVVRTAAWAQRYLVGAEPQGAVGVDAGGGVGARAEIVTDPSTVLMLQAIDGASQPVVGQWGPPVAPLDLIKAVQVYEERLAEGAGLRLDVTRQSSDIRSGYSLAVARESIREAQAGYAPVFRRADVRLLRLTAAALGLDAGPAAGWDVLYQGLPQSPAERRATIDEVVTLRGAGLMGRVEAYMRLHPGVTETDARARLAEIDAEKSATGGQIA